MATPKVVEIDETGYLVYGLHTPEDACRAIDEYRAANYPGEYFGSLDPAAVSVEHGAYRRRPGAPGDEYAWWFHIPEVGESGIGQFFGTLVEV